MTLDETAVYGNPTVVSGRTRPVREPFIEFDFKSAAASLMRNWKPKVALSMLALFAWIPPLLGTLLIVSFLDFVAGILASKAQGMEIDPNKARRGIALKLLLILLAISGYVVQAALPPSIKAAIPDGMSLGSFLSAWIIATEFFSIVRCVRSSGYAFQGPVQRVLMLAISDDDKGSKTTDKP